MHTLERDTLVDTLLEALETERYVRAPLLLTVLDELAADEALSAASDPARELLAAIEAGQIGDAELVRRVRALRGLVQDLSAKPESGVRPRLVETRRPSSSWLEVGAA